MSRDKQHELEQIIKQLRDELESTNQRSDFTSNELNKYKTKYNSTQIECAQFQNQCIQLKETVKQAQQS
jgi:hypothetical protein